MPGVHTADNNNKKKKRIPETYCSGEVRIYGAPFSHLFTELKIYPIEVHISAIELEISAIQLKISAI